jgi:hypothetical protein
MILVGSEDDEEEATKEVEGVWGGRGPQRRWETSCGLDTALPRSPFPSLSVVLTIIVIPSRYVPEPDDQRQVRAFLVET